MLYKDKKMKIILVFIVSVFYLYGYSKEEYEVFNTPLPKKRYKKKKECFTICKEQLEKAEAMDKAIRYYKTTKYHSFSFSKNLSK